MVVFWIHKEIWRHRNYFETFARNQTKNMVNNIRRILYTHTKQADTQSKNVNSKKKEENLEKNNYFLIREKATMIMISNRN